MQLSTRVLTPWPLSLAILFHTHIPVCSLGKHQQSFYFASREPTLGETVAQLDNTVWSAVGLGGQGGSCEKRERLFEFFGVGRRRRNTTPA